MMNVFLNVVIWSSGMLKRIWVYSASLVVTLLLGNAPAMAEIWKVASLNWPPYTDARMTNEGNLVQKLRTLLQPHRIELQVEFYPWKRAIVLAEQPDFIGYFPAWLSEINEGYVASPPVDYSELAAVTVPGKRVEFHGLDDLFSNHTVGIVSAYQYPPFIERVAENHPDNVTEAVSEVLLLKMLNAERFEVAISDPTVMMYLSEKYAMPPVEVSKSLGLAPLLLRFATNPITVNASA